MLQDNVETMRERLERFFEFKRHNTTWRTGILAGFTTFLTMAYIIFVNPSILSQAAACRSPP